MRLRKVVMSCIIVLLFAGQQTTVFADELTTNGYTLEIDNNGLGDDNNSPYSSDQSGEYRLTGNLETFDTGSENTTGSGGGDYRMKTGLQTTFEANISDIATLSAIDGSTSLFDKLVLEIDPNNNPTSADGTLFAVQVDSSLSFSTPKYVNPVGFQIDQVTNSNLSVYYSPCAQTSDQPADDTRWDCGTVGGLVKYIQGLQSNTQYCARVIAKNGDFSNSEPGPGICATTAGLSMSFSVDPNTTSFGLLAPNSVKTATNTTTLQSFTNFSTGYTVRVRGQGDGASATSGLYSSTKGTVIQSLSANLDSTIGLNGYGLQASILSGTPTIVSTWDPTQGGRNSTWVGQISRTAGSLYSYNSAMSSGITHDVVTTYKATLAPTTKAADDYRDTLTYTMSVNP